jgi:hypothetical protein
MGTLQSTYSAQHARWIKGMVLNMEPSVVVSRECEDVEGIGFGEVAVQGTGDHQAVDSEITVKFTGIAVLDETRPNGKYDQYDTAAIMKKGVIVVQASVAVAVGDPVYYVPATGVLTNVSTSNTLIAGAQWDTSTAGAGLAALRLG